VQLGKNTVHKKWLDAYNIRENEYLILGRDREVMERSAPEKKLEKSVYLGTKWIMGNGVKLTANNDGDLVYMEIEVILDPANRVLGHGRDWGQSVRGTVKKMKWVNNYGKTGVLSEGFSKLRQEWELRERERFAWKSRLEI